MSQDSATALQPGHRVKFCLTKKREKEKKKVKVTSLPGSLNCMAIGFQHLKKNVPSIPVDQKKQPLSKQQRLLGTSIHPTVGTTLRSLALLAVKFSRKIN